MSQHSRFRDMLARRSELSPADELQLRGHLNRCDSCRQTAEAYSAQTELLRSLPVAIPPYSLRHNVLEATRRAPKTPAWRRGVGTWVLVPTAAVVLVLGVALAAIHQLTSTHPMKRALAFPPPTPTLSSSTPAPHPSILYPPKPREHGLIARVTHRHRGRPHPPPSVALIFNAAPTPAPAAVDIPAPVAPRLPVAVAPSRRLLVPAPPKHPGRRRIARPPVIHLVQQPTSTVPATPAPTPGSSPVSTPISASPLLTPTPFPVPPSLPTPTPLPLRLPAFIPAPPDVTPTPILTPMP